MKTVAEPGAITAMPEAVQQTMPQRADTPPLQQGESTKAAIPSQSPSLNGAPPNAAPAAQTASHVAMPRPAERYFLLALALGIMTFLFGVVSKIVARRRRPIISDYSDTAWDDRLDSQPIAAQAANEEPYDERDIPYVDSRGHRLADLHHQQADEWPPWRRAAAQSKNAESRPVRASSPSIEPALRVLRQARQRRTV